jgi:subtilisin family serine protease
MTPVNLRILLIGAGLALVAAPFVAMLRGPAVAQTLTVASDNPVFIDLRTPAPSRTMAATALLRKAVARGKVRIIVGLGMALRADHTLADEESVTQIAMLHAEQRKVAARVGVAARDVTLFDYIPFVSMWVNAGQLRRLLSDPSIVNIQEELPGRAGLDQSAPFIKADQVWQQQFKGLGFVIAVLDTGIDKSHRMLKNKVVSEACYATNNPAQGILSLCPGRATESTAVDSALPCIGALDPCWHGTHVAGIAAGKAAKRTPTTTLTGIAPAAKLISIKVFSRQDNVAVTFDSDWIRGLERVYALRKTYRIAAVTLSFGSGRFTGPCDRQNPAATKIIRQLRAVRIAVIAAAMNDGYDNATAEPACISEAIAVGATLHTENTLADFSNHAPWVRLLAPGSGIVSARMGGGFRAGDGTSMAAPHVAGAFALLRNMAKTSTVDDIAAALECTGPLVTRSGVSRPRIDVLAAKAYLLNPPATGLDFGFDTGAPGWVSNVGNWKAFGGYYSIGNFQAGYKVASVATCNEGQDITAENIRRVGSTNLTDPQGILFKAQFATASGQPTILSGYAAVFSRSGAASIRRYDDFDLINATGGVTTLCKGTAHFAGAGSDETLEVQTRGGVHTLLMNGTKVCTVRDSTYGTGSAGIFGYLATNDSTNGLSVGRFTIEPVERVPNAPAADLITAEEPPV